jgi:uncharacterized protein (DUF1810 family)
MVALPAPPFSNYMTERQIQNDKFDLERFVLAQRNIYSRALSEIARGQKTSHWMWFIFPQVKGLGRSYEAQLYGISGLDEAKLYLSHEVLGDRLRKCVSALMHVEGRTALEIFGPIDEMKLRSSLTLFKTAADEQIFDAALQKHFGGQTDNLTLELLGISE